MTAQEFMSEMRRLDRAGEDEGIRALAQAHLFEFFSSLTDDERSEIEGITEGAAMGIEAREWAAARELKKAA